MLLKKDALVRLFLCPAIKQTYTKSKARYPKTALYLLLFLSSTTLYGAFPQFDSNCQNDLSTGEFSEVARVRYIHDGDTLHLTGGRKVRLIGINTPELARSNKPAEPFAHQAKAALDALFSQDKTIALVYGAERMDKYGRLLAHAFTRDGTNVQSSLLKQGLASAITIPPNTRFARCYLEAEQQARCDRAGMWQYNGIINAKKLKQGENGFHLIKGTVKKVTFNKKGIWLNLDDMITLGIRSEEQYLFDQKALRLLQDQTIVVRGWINKGRHDTPYYMRIKDPLSLQQESALSCR